MRRPTDDFQRAFDRWSILVGLSEGEWTEQTGDEYGRIERQLLAHAPATIEEAMILLLSVRQYCQ